METFLDCDQTESFLDCDQKESILDCDQKESILDCDQTESILDCNFTKLVVQTAGYQVLIMGTLEYCEQWWQFYFKQTFLLYIHSLSYV